MTGAAQDLKWSGWRRFLPLLIVVAGVVAYANSFSGTFVLDDDKNIVDNPRIRQIWPLSNTLDGRRPVVDLTLAINFAIGKTWAGSGLDVRSYHALNLGVHLLAGLALFGVVRRTLMREPLRGRAGPAAPWIALAAALIWVVHPLQTQSVTYLIQRAESLMGLFYLLTIYCVIRGADSPRGLVWYALAVISCVCGMGTKAVMVTAPFIVFLYDLTFISRSPVLALRRRWPLYAGLAATLSVLVLTGVVGGVLATDRHGAPMGFSYKGITPAAYAATQIGAIAYYLRLSFWPHPLCLDYAWPAVQGVADVVRPAFVVGPLFAATLWALVRKPQIGFLGAWFFLILAPTSSFIPIKDPAFEHRMYLPLAAVIVAVVLSAYWVLNRLFADPSRGSVPRRSATAILVAVVVSLSIYGTAMRNRDYRSDLVMWNDVLDKRPNNARAHLGLGTALFNMGETERAEKEFKEAVDLRPTYADGFYNLGNALLKNGKRDEAVDAYRSALRLNPGSVKTHYNLGNALKQQGKLEEAVAEYQEAVRLAPRHLQALINMGNSFKQLGRTDEAIEQYRKALVINPRYANTHYNLGDAYRRQGRLEEAIKELELALRYDPKHEQAISSLSAVKDQLREPNED